MVFDIDGLSQARQAVRRELSRGNRGGSPNGNGGQGARHPLAESESGMVLPFRSAGGSAHKVVGPGPGRADQGCILNPYLRIDGHQLAVGIGVVGFTAQVVFVRVVVRFGHDGFAVGDGDLIIIRVDFVEGQEAVAVAAIFNEGGLQARLYAGDLGEVDVPAKLAARTGFEIELLNLAAVHDRDARFFRVRRVYQHGF